MNERNESASQPLSGDADLLRQLIEKANALLNGITPGPWAWEWIAEKSNQWAVGQAFDVEGKPYEGQIPDGEWIEDTVIERRLVGMNESGHASAADAKFIAASPTLLRELVAALSTLQVSSGSAQEWQPIETAPKDAEVLAFEGGAICLVTWFDDGKDTEAGWYDDSGCRLDPAPTHWMPLPAPPVSSARCEVVGEPEAGRKKGVCELPKGHDGYHQQGGVRWLGYHSRVSSARSPEHGENQVPENIRNRP